MTTAQKADQNIDEGRLGSMPTAGGANQSARAAVMQQRSRVVSIRVPADGAANTNLAEQHLAGLQEYAGYVTDVRISVETNVALNATNFATILIQSRDDAGGSPQTVATCNTAVAGALTAYVSSQFVLTANQLAVVAFGKLTIRHDKSGAGGVQLPAYTVTATVLDT